MRLNFFRRLQKKETKEYSCLIEMIYSLRDRISVLEEENIELTNELYRLENSLEARIDILSEKMYNVFRNIDV
jgi:hypothetical protein